MNVVNSSFEPSNVVAEFPLSVTQHQFWFLDQLHPGNPALNVAIAWDVHGRFSAHSLERAYRLVIDRHEILRSRFVEKDGQVVQQVLDFAAFDLDEVDITDLTGDARETRLAEIAAQVARRPFDLSNTGLIRATLVWITPDHARLLTVAHHSVYDGYSIGVMGREIGLATAAFDAGTTPDLPDLPLQYGDFSMWQQEYLASGVMEADTAYWRDQMRDAPYFELPSDFTRPKVRNTEIRYLNVPLQDDFAAQMERVAKRNATSPFVIGAAVAAGALHRVTNAPEILFGTPIVGRQEIELEALIGPFINTQVLRIKTPDGQSFDDHVAHTKKAVEGALVHQNLPFSKLVELVNPVRDASRSPLISMNFNLQHVFMEDQTYGSFNMVSKPTQTPGASRDLDIVIIGRPTGWRLNIEYSPSLYKPETITSLLDMIKQCFAHVFANPDFKLADLPLITANEPTVQTSPADPVVDALRSHPAVKEAVTNGSTDTPWAFVTANPATQVALETLPPVLMAHVADRLNSTTALSGVSILASLPKDNDGAVLLERLPQPGHLASGQQALPTPVGPASPAPQMPELKTGLVSIWQELLEQETIPLDRSFFDLGGHSLLAVRMVARVRKTWNVTLSVAAIYDFPTIQELAGHLAPQIDEAPDHPEEDWRVEPIRTDGTGTPIISVNDISVVLSASDHFENPRPSVCVRLFDGTRGIDQSKRSFEEIAIEYAKVIEKTQPQGPYLFYGACVHGNIALEAARHLQSKGHEIEAVVIKDCWEPGYAAGIRSNPKMRRKERIYALLNRMRLVRTGKMSLTAMLGSYRIVRKSGVLSLAKRLGLIDRVRATDMTAEQEGFVAYISEARNVYRPEPITFPVLHIVTKITPVGRGFLPSIGWENIINRSLKTVHLDDVSVVKGRIAGTDQVAREIETFLAK